MTYLKTKNSRGGTSRRIGRGCAARFLKLLSYFRPKAEIFPTLFLTWSKIWYPISDLKPWSPVRDRSVWQSVAARNTVVGGNTKREMALSPNDEEVADPSKTHTQFKTRVHKPYPISDPIPYFRPKRLTKNMPFGAAHAYTECFHSRGQHLCKFIRTKESVCIRKELNSHRICLGHQHGLRFIVVGHQYGRRYVTWKHSVAYIRDYSPPPPPRGAKNALKAWVLLRTQAILKSSTCHKTWFRVLSPA